MGGLGNESGNVYVTAATHPRFLYSPPTILEGMTSTISLSESNKFAAALIYFNRG